MSKVLIVDDEPAICWALEQALTEEGHQVTAVPSAEDARNWFERETPDVIMMDVRLPGVDGLSAMQTLPEKLARTPVVVMTAFGNLETAVQAIGSGAFEYLPKPFDLDDAVNVIRRALQSNASPEPSGQSSERSTDLGELLIGSSPQMQAVFRQIALAADRDVPVLISGESGTGKELVATALHYHGRRSGGPFVPICVPAMNQGLVESELFGHRRGAFTGAVSDHAGLLEQAHGGVAFFDEIGDVPLATQVKLLRVLETRRISSVGGSAHFVSDFRLIAATNRNLEEMVEAGDFREDLFYRLNVFRIDLPPLRDRAGDIPLLARHFLAANPDSRDYSLTPETIAELESRPWYGNVRELRNAIEHATILARSGSIEPHCLPPPIKRNQKLRPADSLLAKAVQHWLRVNGGADAPQTGMLEAFLQETEPLLIEQALHDCRGNRQEAAQQLGIHRQTLREKMRRYGLDPTV